MAVLSRLEALQLLGLQVGRLPDTAAGSPLAHRSNHWPCRSTVATVVGIINSCAAGPHPSAPVYDGSGLVQPREASSGQRSQHSTNIAPPVPLLPPLQEGASTEDVRRAFRQQALLAHPDKNREEPAAATERWVVSAD